MLPEGSVRSLIPPRAAPSTDPCTGMAVLTAQGSERRGTRWFSAREREREPAPVGDPRSVAPKGKLAHDL